MEDHLNYILDWPYLYKQKSIEELKQSLWLATMELEANKVSVQEEIRARDNQLNQLKHLLNDVVNERNEAQNKYQSLLDKLLLQHQFHHRRRHETHQTATAPPQSGGSCVEDEPITDCEESIFSCVPVVSPVQLPSPPPQPTPAKGLPEYGNFLEAVMKAGPLLQNLLLAGSLPIWREPPPPLEAYQIPSPPLVVPTQPPHNLLSQDYLRIQFNKKRGLSEESDSSTETKYQRSF